MKIFLLIPLLLVVVGCEQMTDSSAKTSLQTPSSALAELYQGQWLYMLQNLSNTIKVSDEDVASLKAKVRTALSDLGFETVPELESEETRIQYTKNGAIISFYTIPSRCEEDRGECFHLEIVPDSTDDYEVRIVKMPSNEALASVLKDFDADSNEDLLEEISKIFPHSLDANNLVINTYGDDVDEHSTFSVMDDRVPRRELHINILDGYIDNSANAQYPYYVRAEEIKEYAGEPSN